MLECDSVSEGAVDETARLQELDALEFDDPALRRQLEPLTHLAADLFNVPIALVTLIEPDYQRFLANHGLEDRHGTTRDEAFCNHTIRHEEMMVVHDLRADARFRDHPFVVGDPYFRFYAGAVLRGPHGHPLGAFCLKDYAPRRFDAYRQRQLLRFARVAETQILAHNRMGAGAGQPAERPADRDPTTGLPLRQGLLDRLGALLRGSASGAVALFDLHLEGVAQLRVGEGSGRAEAFLRAVVEHLRGQLPRQVTLGRWDDDDLMILSPEGVPGCSAEELSEQLVYLLRQRISWDGGSHVPQVAIGICRGGRDDERGNAEGLVALARYATRSHRGQRRANVRLVPCANHPDLARDVDLAHRLEDAIIQGAIVPHYQPRIDLESGRIAGFEALARWHDPELGTVSPGRFIPLAEDTGRISALGASMLRQVCNTVQQWRRQGLPVVPVAVNVAGDELGDPYLGEQIEAILRETGLPGSLLELEVTERVLVEHTEQSMATMKRLTAHGVHFAIDDFGTGYSSFAYLRRLPVRQLKIDRSFTRNMVTDPKDASIVEAIAAMARAMELTTVAEGIEREDQVPYLREFGVDQGQGFLWAAPMPRDDAARLLRDQERTAGQGGKMASPTGFEPVSPP